MKPGLNKILGFAKTLSLILVVAILISAALLAYRFLHESTPYYSDPAEHFKYGSTRGDFIAGIPVGIWNALPELCGQYLPGEGFESLGFIYEPGKNFPVGTSVRRSLGFDRVFINCAACHAGTYRTDANTDSQLVLGMPGNHTNLMAFKDFMVQCVLDEAFLGPRVVQAAQHAGADYDFIDRTVLMLFGVDAIRDGILLLRHRLRYTDREPQAGPGRIDTFGAAKALLNWPLDKIPPQEWVGNADLPSIWLQRQRAEANMHSHWDGNNASVAERNLSASFGSGALPITIDHASVKRVADWLLDLAPPAFPYPIDQNLAMQGKPVYIEYCAACHGQSGSDFSGVAVGKITSIEDIGTDPCRLDNYSANLSVDQNNLYAGFPDKRFTHFRKTYGYANLPLDGIWLRAPYLHGGSVPTLWDLLQPSDQRPKVFYRGNDIYDAVNMGYVSDAPTVNGKALFRFETQCVANNQHGEDCGLQHDPENRHINNHCTPHLWAGNSNRGHEGPEYGTELAATDKRALLEYMKTF